MTTPHLQTSTRLRSSLLYVCCSIGLIYFPILGRLTPWLTLKYSYVKYSAAVGVITAAIAWLISPRASRFQGLARILFVTLCVITTLVISKGIADAMIADAIQRCSGVIVAASVMVILKHSPAFGVRNSRFVEMSAVCIGIVFCLQLLLSSIESFRGVPFAEYEYSLEKADENTVIERDLLSASTSGRVGFGLNSRLSGMLGQHNHYGMMLLSLIGFYVVARDCMSVRWPMILALVGIIGLAGNGTRSAFVIGIGIVGVASLAASKRNVQLWLGALVVFVLGIALVPLIAERIFVSGVRGDIGLREELWAGLWAVHFPPREVSDAVFGLRIPELAVIREAIRPDSPGGSVESEYLEVYFLAGVVGLLGFVAVGVRWALEGFDAWGKQGRPGLLLAGFGFFVTSVVMDGMLGFAVLPFVAWTILCWQHHVMVSEYT